MSLVLNMVGGGGGGLTATDAMLRVQATANAVVTITKGSVTKTDLGHENADSPNAFDYYFIIPQSLFDSVNPWTVTATLGTKTQSGTIIIDSASEYNMNLSFHVPNEYQEVEFLSSTGTQYITLGNTSRGLNGAIADFQRTADNAGSAVFGGRDNNTGTGFIFIRSGGSARFVAQPGSNLYITTDLLGRHYLKMGLINSSKLEFDGEVVGTMTTTYAQNTNMRVFAEYCGGIGMQGYSYERIYYIAFYRGDDLAFELYPCYRKSDSVAGMYDTVSGTFFTNAGSGTFTVGPDV